MSISTLFLNLSQHHFNLEFGESILDDGMFWELSQLDFSESGLKVKKILESVYLDGITGLEDVKVDGKNITGIFLDYVSPSLTRRFKFTITPNDVNYQMANLSQDFSEYLDYAKVKTPKVAKTGAKTKAGKSGKTRQCTEGKSFACGATCLPISKKCRSNPMSEDLKSIQKEIVASSTNRGTRLSDNKYAVKTDTGSQKGKDKNSLLEGGLSSAIKSAKDKTKAAKLPEQALKEKEVVVSSQGSEKPTKQKTEPAQTIKSFRIDESSVEDGAATELNRSSILDSAGNKVQIHFGDGTFANRQLRLSKTPQVKLLYDKQTGDIEEIEDKELQKLGYENRFQGGALSDPKVRKIVDKVSDIRTNLLKQSISLGNLSNGLVNNTRLLTVALPEKADSVALKSLIDEAVKSVGKDGGLVAFVGNIPETLKLPVIEYENGVFVAGIKDGKLTKEDKGKLLKRIEDGKEVRALRESQFLNGIEFEDPDTEKEYAEQANSLEDKLVGRKPKKGVVRSEDYYRQAAEDWAKSMGFSGGANGYTEEATKAHDIAHPVTHEMLKTNSQKIHQDLGGIKDDTGANSLVAEEAIVNIVEHLSRGDSLEASVRNGVRLARVLSRTGHSKEATDFFRSPKFRDLLDDMAEKIYRNDNYNEYMELVARNNRKSGTVNQSGDTFTTTASGG